MSEATEARLIWIADRYYWLVVAAGMVGLVQLARRRDPEAMVLVGSAAMTALIPLAFFGDQRFKVPVMPLLIIAAGCLADGKWGRGRTPIHVPDHPRDADGHEPVEGLVGVEAADRPAEQGSSSSL